MLTVATGSGGAPALFGARRFIGTSANRDISGYGFQPDLIWINGRDTTSGHYLFDSIRGPGAAMWPSSTGASYVYAGSHPQTVTRDGFKLEGSSAGSNETSKKYDTWCWKAGGRPTAAGKRKTNNSSTETTLVSSNTVGANNYHTNITNVKQSVNSEGDFSITQYTANSSAADAHLCHGLSGAPDFIIVKSMTTNPWVIWHSNLGSTTQGYLQFTTAAETAHAEIWNNTIANRATSVDFGAHSYTNNNANPYMMYAWKNVAGVSHFGGYTGVANSSSHTITGVGFSPKFIIIKSLTAGRGWAMHGVGSGMGGAGNTVSIVFAESASVEHSGTYGITPNSDGWSMATDNGHIDYSGNYIYAAFA
jgi:hypothetical protein